VERINDRQGFLVSATVHLLVIMALAKTPREGKTPSVEKAKSSRPETVFLPPPSVLRKLVPVEPAPRRAPPPPPVAARQRPALPPEPPSPEKKDKISIGGPSDEKPKGPLVLRKDQEVQAPKGKPNAAPSAPPEAPPAREAQAGGGAPEVPGAPGLKMPPGLLGTGSRGEEGSRAKPGPQGPSIAQSLRNLDHRLKEDGQRGLVTGTGQQMGPLFFDPEGADFTVWINHFRGEVYRNWIMPQPALLGFRGHVDLEFTVERDGSLTNLHLLKSSGTPALDKAAENALLGSRLMRLPSDFGPPRVTMQVSFFYNEGPQPS
jgi:protein TonB